MSGFVVHRHIDKITIVTVDVSETERNYFDTEQEAKDFIVSRAHGSLIYADNQLKGAMRRYNKVVKKFGQPQ